MEEKAYQTKIDILSQVFVDYRTNRKEFCTLCPSCNHNKKLIIDLEKDVFHCWVCNYGGKIVTLLKSYGTQAAWNSWKRIENIKTNEDLRSLLEHEKKQENVNNVKLPPEAMQLEFGIPSVVSTNCFHYLLRRGLTREVIKMYNIHYSETGKYRDRVIIPSYDENARLNFFVARSVYNEETLKYINPPIHKEDIIFNELFITWEKPIVLVEGLFDSLVVNKNTIPLLGSSLSENSLLFKKIMNFRPQITLMLDNDEPGIAATKKIAKLLINWGINLSLAEPYEAKDPGSLSREQIAKSLNNRRRISQSDLMKKIILE